MHQIFQNEKNPWSWDFEGEKFGAFLCSMGINFEDQHQVLANVQGRLRQILKSIVLDYSYKVIIVVQPAVLRTFEIIFGKIVL